MPDSAVLPDWSPLKGARLARVLSRQAVFTSYLIEISGTHRVLRVDTAAAGRLGLDRGGEFAVLLQVSAAGLGPAPIAVHEERGLLLMEYLPGRVLAQTELGQARRLAQLGELLARVQGCVAEAGAGALPGVDLAKAARRYAALCGDEASFQRAAAIEQTLAVLLAASPGAVMAHNDIHAGNVIVCPDDSLRLIDWEYAGLGPGGFDLAAVLVQSDLPQSGEEQLFREYLRSGGIAAAAELPAWRAVYRGISWPWSGAVARLA